MSARIFIAELRRRGIQLSADGDALRVRAPRGALTDEVRDALALRKAEVQSWLRRESSARRLLADLGRRGVEVGIVGDRLRVRAAKGIVTREQVQALNEYKPEVVALLRGDAPLPPPSPSAVVPSPPPPSPPAPAGLIDDCRDDDEREAGAQDPDRDGAGSQNPQNPRNETTSADAEAQAGPATCGDCPAQVGLSPAPWASGSDEATVAIGDRIFVYRRWAGEALSRSTELF
jgi:hypothetical protein